MKFQLDFNYSSAEKISCKDFIFLIGSCFAEEIGEKFAQHRFHSVLNPSGILFNPHSISFALNKIIAGEFYSSSDILQHNNLFHCLHHHGSFSSSTKEETLKNTNQKVESARDFLRKKGWLIVTFGSAFAWRHKKNDCIVANCHKIPGSEFEKIFLKPEEIYSQWKNLVESLRKFNPDLKILFTVSPVRYIRDGLAENNRSKASLLTAVHNLCEEGYGHYFPAYELVNDVLRDYRFFKEDMVHPTKQAINFVWEKFLDTMVDEGSRSVIDEISKFNLFEKHRPIHEGEQQDHLKKIADKKKALSGKYQFLYWD
jgi:hypothetical protein